MTNQQAQKLITIPNALIQKNNGVVILPLKEYKMLCKKTAPVYYLEEEEMNKLDKLIENGLKDYREKKCKTIKSLADLD